MTEQKVPRELLGDRSGNGDSVPENGRWHPALTSDGPSVGAWTKHGRPAADAIGLVGIIPSTPRVVAAGVAVEIGIAAQVLITTRFVRQRALPTVIARRSARDFLVETNSSAEGLDALLAEALADHSNSRLKWAQRADDGARSVEGATGGGLLE